jgi:HAMP domain-containing protein
MADFLPPAVQKFIADTKEYNDPVNRSADTTKKFGRAAEEAGISAKRAFENSAESARKLAIAEEEVEKAAKKLKNGLIDEAEAAKISAKATQQKVKADLAVRESALAAANAADKEAAQFRQVARDAALMEAATTLANARSAGSVRQNRDEIKALSAAFPELRRDAQAALKEADNGFKNMFKGAMDIKIIAIPAVIGAITQLPAIASAAGGLVTLGLGAAGTAIGMKFAAGSQIAKTAITDLKKHSAAAMKDLSKPFQQTWVALDNAAHDAFNSIEPSARSMFNNMAEGSSLFLRRTGQAFYKLGPMFDSLGVAYKKVMDALGGRMPSILANIGAGFTAMFDAVANHPETISNLVEDVALLVHGLGDLIAFLTNAQAKFGTVFSALSGYTGVFLNLAKAAGWTEQANKSFTQSQVNVVYAIKDTSWNSDHLVDSLEAQRTTVDNLKAAFDRYTGANQSAATAEINMQQAIDDTTAAIKANGHTLDTNTQKGRDNYKQLVATAKAFQDKIVAMKNDGATGDQLNNQMSTLRNTFYRLALQMTGNKNEAKKLTDQLLGVAKASKSIPKTINQTIHVHTVYTSSGSTTFGAGNKKLGNARGGPPKRLADGGPSGWVIGPGSETSDSVPALLSKNEFVINAKDARKHAQLLQQINAGAYTHRLPPPTVSHPSKNAKHANFTADKSAQYSASHAAASMMGAYRRSTESAWMTQGGIGSGRGVVVQHVTNVTVMGSIMTEREFNDRIQENTLQRNLRNPTSGVNLQGGRIGVS